MLKRLRTYSSIVLLAIAGLFLVCLAIDEYRDASLSVCVNSSILDSLSVDDIDLDENNLITTSSVVHHHRIGTYPIVYVSAQNFNSANIAQISKELRIGLVRRYSPRNMSFSWVNCTLLCMKI